jgi:hypothetical protein
VTAEEYAALQAAISAALVAAVLQLAKLFQAPLLTPFDWERLLDLLFPFVDEARTKSADLGRRFYDSQRALHRPNDPKQDLFLAEYHREWFSEAMFPARQAMLRPGAPDSAVAQVALRAVKEVENGGRRTVLRPVQHQEDRAVLGWARVATGRETCGFCMMLVSRGPVYTSAENAGLDTDDTTAKELFARGDQKALDELMTRWHAGCDCKVVPVFDRADWPGRDAFLRAEQIWKDTTRGFSGQDAVNAFRRAIERGDVDVREMSIAA